MQWNVLYFPVTKWVGNWRFSIVESKELLLVNASNAAEFKFLRKSVFIFGEDSRTDLFSRFSCPWWSNILQMLFTVSVLQSHIMYTCMCVSVYIYIYISPYLDILWRIHITCEKLKMLLQNIHLTLPVNIWQRQEIYMIIFMIILYFTVTSSRYKSQSFS